MGRLIVFCGPPGVGKTAIFRELESRGKGKTIFSYSDRPPRNGETERVCVSRKEFDRLERDGKFCAVNRLYGFRYGTPREETERIIASDKIALQDFPLERVNKLAIYKPYVFYVLAPTIEELKRRLTEGGRAERLPEAIRQTEWFLREGFKCYHGIVEEILINESVEKSAERVIEVYESF